jgi:hypothetical protein
VAVQLAASQEGLRSVELVWQKFIDISEEHATSLLRESQASLTL